MYLIIGVDFESGNDGQATYPTEDMISAQYMIKNSEALASDFRKNIPTTLFDFGGKIT